MDMIEILGILNGGTAEESKQLALIKKNDYHLSSISSIPSLIFPSPHY